MQIGAEGLSIIGPRSVAQGCYTVTIYMVKVQCARTCVFITHNIVAQQSRRCMSMKGTDIRYIGGRELAVNTIWYLSPSVVCLW